MIFKLLPILKFITNSRAVTNTVNNLIKQFSNYKQLKNVKTESADLQKILDLQSEINEKLENQIYLLQEALDNLNKTVRRITIVVSIALILSVISLLIMLF
jgi:septal ring factor EnvC (AmiA/AmiB activator)